MKHFLVLSALLMSSAAFAKLPAHTYEICKGASKSGVKMTVTGNFNDGSQDKIAINANGERLIYATDPASSGDVEESYTSNDNGGLKITFYDEDSTASGWTAQLGAFKLNCVDNK
jgi:hypothetical protein